eukprot:1143708-Pelagomonas_calceolata.AAC.2
MKYAAAYLAVAPMWGLSAFKEKEGRDKKEPVRAKPGHALKGKAPKVASWPRPHHMLSGATIFRAEQQMALLNSTNRHPPHCTTTCNLSASSSHPYDCTVVTACLVLYIPRTTHQHPTAILITVLYDRMPCTL